MSNDKLDQEGAPSRALPKLVSTGQQQQMESVAAAAGIVQARKLAKARGESLPVVTSRPAATQPRKEQVDPDAQAIIEDFAISRPKPAPSPARSLTLRQLRELTKPGAGDVVESDWDPVEVTKKAPLTRAPVSGAAIAALALRKKG